MQTFADPSVFPWLCLVLGLLVGSFLNVAIHRLPAMLKRDWRTQSVEVLSEWAEEKSAPATLTGCRGALERIGKEIADGPRYNLFVPRSACPNCGHRISAIENIPLLSYLVLRGRCAAC